MHAIVDLFFIPSCSILVPILIAKYRVIMMKCQIRNREFGAVGCIIYNFFGLKVICFGIYCLVIVNWLFLVFVVLCCCFFFI